MYSCNRSAIIRKIMLMMVLVPSVFILLSLGKTASAHTDTTWSVSFRLNMTKAVDQHIFRPDSDYVYVIMDHGIEPFRLVPGPSYTYTGLLYDQLDSGITYNYKFRINDNVLETVNRTVTAQQGVVNVSAWWNNDPLNYTSFTVDMKYAVLSGRFNPDADTVCIVGTMNNMQGSPRMQRVDTTLSYNYVYSLDPGTIVGYKYRINADSSGLELLNKPQRMLRVPDTLLEITNDFDNYNPAKRLMTFKCDMNYYISAHHFYPSTDYLEVFGNFNESNAHDVLIDMAGDSIYSLDLYLDTTWFTKGPLEFKFLINGDWDKAELDGKPYRSYTFHDTIHQDPNIFSCFYNNLDPSILTRPWVFNLEIQGDLIHKKFLSGSYSYENVNGIPEGISTYRWLRSDNAEGTDAVPIDTAVRVTYTVDTLDIGKWLVFEVTPVAASGDSATGYPVQVVSSNSISAWDVGIGEHEGLITLIYPNPAVDLITIQTRKEVERLELVNQMGQIILKIDGIRSRSVRMNIKQIPGGFYFLRAFTSNNESGSIKLIKQ